MAAYLRGSHWKSKKQSRFDKMNKKEILGFAPKLNPIVTKFGKSERTINKILLEHAFEILKK